MTTEGSDRERRLAIRVPHGPLVERPWCSDGELVRILSTKVRPATDLHLRDSERTVGQHESWPDSVTNSEVIRAACGFALPFRKLNEWVTVEISSRLHSLTVF